MRRWCNPFFTGHGPVLKWTYHIATWVLTQVYVAYCSLQLVLLWPSDVWTFCRLATIVSVWIYVASFPDGRPGTHCLRMHRIHVTEKCWHTTIQSCWQIFTTDPVGRVVKGWVIHKREICAFQVAPYCRLSSASRAVQLTMWREVSKSMQLMMTSRTRRNPNEIPRISGIFGACTNSVYQPFSFTLTAWERG